MKTFLKIVAGILVVLILALAVFIYTFDANNYKQQLTEIAEKMTGRSITIKGNIDLSVYPWIGLKVDNVTIANKPDFSQKSFATVEQFDIKIKMIPLLQQRLEIDQLVMTQLVLNLEKNLAGDNNWSDFTGSKNSQNEAYGSGFTSIVIGGIELIDSSVYWREATGKQFSITAVNLQTEEVIQGQPLPITLKARIKSNQPVWHAAVVIKSNLKFNNDSLVLNAKDLRMAANMLFPSAAMEKVSFSLAADSDINLGTHSARLNKARIKTLGLLIDGDFDVENIFSIPVVQGPLAIRPFNIGTLLENFKIKAPEMKNESSLKNISLKSLFKTDFSSIYMDEIKGNIDSSYVNGFIHIKNMTQPLVRYDFNVDKLDLHDYRLVTGKSGQDTVPLPLDFLRSADMSGVLNIESLALDDLQLMGFNATTNIKDGVVKINPVSMKVKESTVSAAMRLSVHSQPYGAMRIKASNVDSRLTINPWLKTLLGDNALQLDGAISLDASLKLKGDNLTMLRESAEGKIKLNMGKTTVYGIDLDHASRTVVADYANKNNFRTRSSYVPEYNPQEPVVFNSLSANYTLSYGKLMTKDLILKSDLADVKLTGNIDLIKEVIGYRLVLDMHVKNPVDIRDKLRNHPMEYSSRGTFGRVVTDFDYNHYDHLVSRMLMIEAKSRKIRQIKQSQQKSGRLY